MKTLKEENHYTKEITVNTNASIVFSGLTQKLHVWWGKTDGPVQKVGDEFTVFFGEASWTFRIIEYVPNLKLTWLCIGGRPEFNAEWIRDVLYWTFKESNNSTTISLLQEGLTPDKNCYDICAPTWDKFILISLKSFVETGRAVSF